MDTFENNYDFASRFWEHDDKHHYVLVKDDKRNPLGYMIMRADNRQYVLIEDNNLAALAVDRMLALGFTVYETWDAYHQAVPLKPKPTPPYAFVDGQLIVSPTDEEWQAIKQRKGWE